MMPLLSRHARIGLVWQFAIAFSVITLLTGAFLYAAVRNYANDNIRTSSLARMGSARAAVFSKIDAHLGLPEGIVRHNAALARHGRLPLNDEQRLARFFLEQVLREPSLDYLYFANEQGGIASGGTQFGEFRIIYTKGMRQGMRTVERVDSSGGFLARLPPPWMKDFDPRKRPWYVSAKQGRRLVWDLPQIGTVTFNPALTLACPLIGPSGEFLGVFGGNVMLDSLGDYLESHRSSPNAYLMLLEPDGTLIANSIRAPLIPEKNGKAGRLKAETVRKPLAREAAGLVGRAHGSRAASIDTLLDDGTGRAYYVDIAPYHRGPDICWYLVTVAPRSDFAGPLDALWSRFLMILLGGAIGAVGLSLAMAGWVTRPMRAINEQVKRLAGGKFGGRVETRRRDEIGQLARSFNDMSERLAGTYEEIRSKNEALQRENAERRQAEAERRKTEDLLHGIVETIPALIFVKDLDGRFLLVNRHMAEVIGVDAASMLGKTVSDVYSPGQAQALAAFDRRVLAAGEAIEGEEEMPSADGLRTYILIEAPLTDADGRVYALCGISTEITARKRAEEALRRSEEQLRQAQKMEAIGNLAGGIAHDFNNLLSVILGYSSLLLPSMGPDDKRRAGVEQIDRAGMRAAALTQQLLAFSRKQLLQPRIINLNDILADVEPLLRRLIGENIELTVRGSRELGCVRADPSRMEQILMNLAVNSRDAMPRGGKLLIETANVDLDRDHAAQLGAEPGAYVMLAVTDNGIGMDRATQARIFEPFFTTKEVGKGTGLGLATVFGIMQQSGGNIKVDSEPGIGTTFSVYLPRTDEAGENKRDYLSPVLGALEGSETILLVEDEEQVRTLVRAILQSYGYQVIEAQTGGDALLVSEKHAGAIDLLLTDVIMPHISGPQLAQRLGRLVAKVLYMTGYTEDSMVRQGLIDSSVALLQKPITPEALVRKIREVLDSPPDAFKPPAP
jgi:PAS domain S-box-containing protein